MAKLNDYRGYLPLVLSLLAFLVSGSIAITVTTDNDGSGPNPPKDITFTVNQGAKESTTIKVAEPLVSQAKGYLQSSGTVNPASLSKIFLSPGQGAL